MDYKKSLNNSKDREKETEEQKNWGHVTNKQKSRKIKWSWSKRISFLIQRKETQESSLTQSFHAHILKKKKNTMWAHIKMLSSTS